MLLAVGVALGVRVLEAVPLAVAVLDAVRVDVMVLLGVFVRDPVALGDMDGVLVLVAVFEGDAPSEREEVGDGVLVGVDVRAVGADTDQVSV